MPRQAWSDKEERQYEHIKESAQKRGQTGRAKQIAARTVNKQRSEQGKTKQPRGASTSRGKAASTGARSQASSRSSTSRTSSSSTSLQSKTKKELYEQAKRMEIGGRSQMSKGQLMQAINKSRR